MRDHDDHAGVVDVPVHEFAHERQKAPLHFREALALAIAGVDVLFRNPFAGQVQIDLAHVVGVQLDTKVDFYRFRRQCQRQSMAERQRIGGLDGAQLGTCVDAVMGVAASASASALACATPFLVSG